MTPEPTANPNADPEGTADHVLDADSPGSTASTDSVPAAASDEAAWSTGDARVDDAVARLGDLDERDLDEHADVYDTIHGDLADVLDDAGTTTPS